VLDVSWNLANFLVNLLEFSKISKNKTKTKKKYKRVCWLCEMRENLFTRLKPGYSEKKGKKTF